MAENIDAADQAQALPAQRIEATDLGFAQGDALRVEDVTRILHVSRNTVYKLARKGELPSYRVGRQMRFRYDDVRARLESVAASQETKAAVASGADEPSDVPVPDDATVRTTRRICARSCLVCLPSRSGCSNAKLVSR